MLRPAFALLVACIVALSPPLAAADRQITAPPVAARAFFVIDLLSDQVIVELNADTPSEPASLTKLMTAYVVFNALKAKKLDLKQPVKVSERAWRAEGSRMFIEPSRPVTVEELLQGLIVQSGNDAAIALAEAVAGSEDTFVQAMNDEAKRMGLAGTHFTNSTGLPNAQHYSTARDIARLAARLVVDHPEYYHWYSQREYRYNNINQANRNRLLWIDANVDGMKTGHTDAAGYCLVATARRGERRVLSVLMGAASDALRASESQKLLNFAFLTFETRKLYAKNQAVATPEVFKGSSTSVPIGFARDIWLTMPADRFQGLMGVAEYTQPLIAPFAKGQKIGVMKLTRDNEKIAEFPLVALEDVATAGFLRRGVDAIRLMFK